MSDLEAGDVFWGESEDIFYIPQMFKELFGVFRLGFRVTVRITSSGSRSQTHTAHRTTFFIRLKILFLTLAFYISANHGYIYIKIVLLRVMSFIK